MPNRNHTASVREHRARQAEGSTKKIRLDVLYTDDNRDDAILTRIFREALGSIESALSEAQINHSVEYPHPGEKPIKYHSQAFVTVPESHVTTVRAALKEAGAKGVHIVKEGEFKCAACDSEHYFDISLKPSKPAPQV